ncbi:hypothetical protein E2C01_002151 [Portunus trituberculatus]|uniref:Uncharacterized protein n=1 Tax=Portunus trituberculatus TaxID=210409 RepID=A0A5B7CMD4_PORTR|nr:hypothetical protein [Portunus trituberculatus]
MYLLLWWRQQVFSGQDVCDARQSLIGRRPTSVVVTAVASDSSGAATAARVSGTAESLPRVPVVWGGWWLGWEAASLTHSASPIERRRKSLQRVRNARPRDLL